jgi:hypothetical protein
MTKAILDHLVVTAATLASGVDHVERTLGQPMDGGGDHVAMGTHNRLMSMGPEDYLEVIAVNPDATAPGRPRFFDLDNRTGAAALTNWVLRVDDLSEALKRAPEGTGQGVALSRGPYAWRMAIPADGKLPFDGLFPSLIQWDTAHPAPSIPDGGARLISLTLSHPRAEALAAALAPLFTDPRVSVHEGPVGLSARIRSGGSEVTLA